MLTLKDALTERDGTSLCPVRAGFIAGLLLMMGLTILDTMHGVHFLDHAHDWLGGLAEYLGFGGGAIAYKQSKESPDGN